MAAPSKALENLETIGGHPALDFVNTVHSWHALPVPDYLRDFDDFLAWNRLTGLLNPAAVRYFKAMLDAEKSEAFKEARELRDKLYRIFLALATGRAVPQGALDRLNDIVQRTAASHRLAVVEGADRNPVRCVWQFAGAASIAALGPVAWSAFELLQSSRLEHLKECPSDSCGWLFIDASKNHSRTWCSMKTCGNAAKVKRFRRRSTG